MFVHSRVTIPDEELELSFARSGGPGGQNVNKRDTKAVLSWDIAQSRALPIDIKGRFFKTYSSRLTSDGRIVIASDEERSREANIDSCYEKLKAMILAVIDPPKPRRPTKPSRASKERRLGSKKLRTVVKQGRQKVDY